MKTGSKVQVYDSLSPVSHQAFQVFLNYTDQKVNCRRWLDAFVGSLPAHRVFLDAGAGTGQTTGWFIDKFERTIAIEPSPSLSAELRRICRQAEVLPVPILEARPDKLADLILCSHVLYYIDVEEWQAHLARMASWLAPKGALVIVLQNPDTDCMRMVEALLGKHLDLHSQVLQFEQESGNRFQSEGHLVPAHVTTPDFASAYAIAEFMLNVFALPDPPAKNLLEDYVRTHFKQPGAGYRFSCHQDCLVIRQRQQTQAMPQRQSTASAASVASAR